MQTSPSVSQVLRDSLAVIHLLGGEELILVAAAPGSDKNLQGARGWVWGHEKPWHLLGSTNQGSMKERRGIANWGCIQGECMCVGEGGHWQCW